ncbi:hypothetical protein CCMA1212_010145 [Trichoderma ghanense]|uniref:Uncharacterized protein n=1 Tax=Trichoderma ghanense TaxID=65468 RepID=A0ABY2GQC0_9HYPO
MLPKQLALCTFVPTRHGSAICRFRPPRECEYEPVSSDFAPSQGTTDEETPLSPPERPLISSPLLDVVFIKKRPPDVALNVWLLPQATTRLSVSLAVSFGGRQLGSTLSLVKAETFGEKA